MTDRTVHYYQMPTAPGFADHMIEETGLNKEQKAMAWDWRNYFGDTQFYADRANMPVKRYNSAAACIHMRMVSELIRLAQIGWETEKNRSK